MSLDEKNYGQDAPGTINTTDYLTYGVEDAYGAISAYGAIGVGLFDTDWYQLHADIGSTYRITLKSSLANTIVPSTGFDVRDKAGNVVQYGVLTAGQTVQYTMVANATNYYVEVFGVTAGDYSLRADNISVTEQTDYVPLGGGQTLMASLSYTGQENSYAVSLTAGTTYCWDLTTATTSSLLLTLTNAADQRVLSTTVTPGEIYSYVPTVSGTYILGVSSSSFFGRGNYTLSSGESGPGGGSGVVVTRIDTTTSNISNPFMATYTGPVAGLKYQFVDLSSDNLNITATAPNVFLHSGAGEDALQVTSGNNVMDGSTGSNFLVGGTGNDTFFADIRGASADIWDTLVNFHTNDAATIWGVTQAGFGFNYADNQGAAGYTGLTITAAASGKPNTSLTLPGYTTADLSNGRLSITFGTETSSGSPYAYIHAN